MEDVDVMLRDGTIVTTMGDHLWEDAGVPGLSRCQCGIYRHYDRHQGGYWYSTEEAKQ